MAFIGEFMPWWIMRSTSWLMHHPTNSSTTMNTHQLPWTNWCELTSVNKFIITTSHEYELISVNYSIVLFVCQAVCQFGLLRLCTRRITDLNWGAKARVFERWSGCYGVFDVGFCSSFIHHGLRCCQESVVSVWFCSVVLFCLWFPLLSFLGCSFSRFGRLSILVFGCLFSSTSSPHQQKGIWRFAEFRRIF